jgi:chaperonin GroES
MKTKTYKVLGDRILVQRDPLLEQVEGLLLMPENIEKKPSSGTVITCGSKVEDVQEGDKVFFNEYAGYFLDTDQTLEESDLIVMREDEILAIEQEAESAEVAEVAE